MDASTRARVETFIKPLYQDLDGVSRFGDLERIEKIARILHQTDSAEEEHHFTLMILFHGLDRWLRKMGSVSRACLVIGEPVSESDLRQVSESLRRLDAPATPAERALAAAILIDAAGARGLALRMSHARREGTALEEIAREEVDTPQRPPWLDARSLRWLEQRDAARRRACSLILAELKLEDAPD